MSSNHIFVPFLNLCHSAEANHVVKPVTHQTEMLGAGTFTREALESNANFDGRNSAARYQLSIAVSAPFLDHDFLYCSRSVSEKTPGGEVFRSTRTSSAQSRLRRMHSGNQGS